MSKVFDQLLAARGFSREFLEPKYDELVDAFLLPDMEKTVERLKLAAKNHEKVLIYGDYDVDGVTASVVMHDVLALLKLTDVEIMLPNRFTDGYGMSKKVVQRVKETGVGLVITVDCGSRNNEIISDLKNIGVDTIVTDHHECGAELPEAVAIVNPKRKDVEVMAELQELAGVGVAFKVGQALVQAGMVPDGQEKWLLDLVALGTVCDSMRLTGENRRLCHYGMMVLGKTRRPGLKELMRNSGVKTLNGDAIGFQIGPRLNAAGRMKTAEKALDLLLTKQRPIAVKLALELEELNKKRKSEQMSAVREITERGVGQDAVIIERGEWHEGVLGIIAGKLTETYKRPAFVLGEVDGVLKGSGRSFGDFNLAAALDMCRQYVIGGGGHAGACGVKIEKDRLADFRQAINEYYKSLKLVDQERFLETHEDMIVEDFDELSLELLEELRILEPYGEGNPEPVFLLPEVRVVEAAKLGENANHLRLVVWDHQGKSLKLMAFAAPEEYLNLRGGEIINAWITLNENVFRGIRSVEGRIVKLG